MNDDERRVRAVYPNAETYIAYIGAPVYVVSAPEPEQGKQWVLGSGRPVPAAWADARRRLEQSDE